MHEPHQPHEDDTKTPAAAEPVVTQTGKVQDETPDAAKATARPRPIAPCV